MKTATGLLVLLVVSSALAIIYGVIFSFVYPFVAIDAGIVALLALAGVLTYFLGWGALLALSPRK
jgi:hypothetical protein